MYRDEEHRWRLLAPSEGGPTEMIALLLSEQVMEPLRGSELVHMVRDLHEQGLAAHAGGEARGDG